MKENVMDLGDGIDNRNEKGTIHWSEYYRQESELTNSINYFEIIST